jgi:transposase
LANAFGDCVGRLRNGTIALELVYDLHSLDNERMKRKKYASDISREKFEEIEPMLRSVRRRTKPATVDLYEVFCAVLYLLRTGCQWRFLPSEFPKWQTVYAYFSKWSQPDQHGVSVLERALKKSGWRGPYETGAKRTADAIDRGRAEREEHGHSDPQGL